MFFMNQYIENKRFSEIRQKYCFLIMKARNMFDTQMGRRDNWCASKGMFN